MDGLESGGEILAVSLWLPNHSLERTGDAA